MAISPRSRTAAAIVLVVVVLLTGLVGARRRAAAQEVSPAATLDPSGEFTAITPARLVDTRIGTGGVTGPLGQAAVMNVQVAGAGGVPASGVAAAVLNVTAVDPTAAGYLTLFPAGEALPLASTVDFAAGPTVPNLATVKLGANGAVSVYNNVGMTQVVIDVVGFYSTSSGIAGTRFHAVTPSRILDTRPNSAIGPGGTLTVQVTGHGGVPAGATAVAMNVTVADPTTGGFLTVYPSDVAQPPTSNLNFSAGQTVPNLVDVRLPPAGSLNFFNFSGSTQVVVDVTGYYDTNKSTEAGRFVALSPSRILDTRITGPVPGPSSTIPLQVAGLGGVPGGTTAGAVVANVTVTTPSAGSFLTVYPSDVGRPPTSNLNFVAGQTVANLAMVALSQNNGSLNIYNYAGYVQVIVDVSGYFTQVVLGFDACEAPSPPTMQAWKNNSPYTVIGIYIGGGERACANTALSTPDWVNSVSAQGWRFIPIYVGLQAACSTFQYRIDNANAYAQGVVNANDAAKLTAAAGIGTGRPIYFDMEGYDTTVAGCSTGVQNFLAGWSDQLRASGYVPAVYSSLASGIADEATAAQQGISHVDAIWIAAWNNSTNLFGFTQSQLPDSLWSQHQRIHQYVGGHNETYGGVTINIDNDVVDGPLAP